MRRTSLVVRHAFLLGAFLCTTPLQAAEPAGSPAKPKDVLVIVADDINWHDVDNISTPTLDRLMSVGTTWRRFYTSPVCSTTRYALQYGRWPRRDGIYNVLESSNPLPGARPHPDEGLVSLGDLFQSRGYLSGFFGKWHTGVQFYGPAGGALPHVSPLFIGYDTWRAGTMGNIPTISPNSSYYLWDRLDDRTQTFGVTTYVDEDLIDTLRGWWNTTSASPRPRFAFVGTHLAHGPFHVPPESLRPPGHPAPTTTREQFECMVVALDLLLDRLIKFDAADPDGAVKLRDTLVVFLADNGTPIPAAGSQDPGKVKGSTFDGGIRCPLVIAGDGFEAGRVEDEQIVSAVDLFSTLAVWLGGKRPAGVAEDSIPIQTGRRTWAMSEYVSADDDFALVWDDWKLRRFNGVETLYDLVSDPTESFPLDPRDPGHAAVVNQIRKIEERLPDRF